MDLDEAAVAGARANARRNGLEATFDHGDVFDALRAYAAGPPEARPDVVVVDPPKWARDRSGLGAALTKYRDLNRLAMQAAQPGGIVVTNSCSGLVSRDAFLDVLKAAALDTRKEVRILHEGGAGPDHPVSAVVPESRYLKCVFLSVGPPGSGPGSRETERAPRARRES
jgi:23S rRNA (cytosine1962-C5)-methyltransferase